MKNPFHEIEHIVKQENADTRQAVHALLAVMHLETCSNCNSKLRSEEFLLAFEHLLKELKLCHQLSLKDVA